MRSTLKRPYQSWGVKRRLELHIANENHYSFDDPFPFPKLFVYSKGELAFGFYIEAPVGDVKSEERLKYGYWHRFKDRLLNDPSITGQLIQAMDKHKLTLTDYYRWERSVFGGSFSVDGGRIYFGPKDRANQKEISPEELIRRITEPQVIGRSWMDLHVFAQMDKDLALTMKGEVATPILRVLQDLAWLYEISIQSPTRS